MRGRSIGPTPALSLPRREREQIAAARRWLLVGGLLLLAALLRVATIFYHEIPGDDATVALVGKHFLTGEGFPVFFYRQAYMGSLNGIHLVPAVFLFGPSVVLVQLNAALYSLLFPFLLYLLVRRLFDEATARATLLLAAVPPFLLTKWSATAEPHFETNLFGLVLLLLALAALEAAPGSARSTRILACFGLAAGLAWWTNFKALELILPVLLVLVVRDPRLPLRRATPFMAGSFLLGSLPVWAFYAARAHGDAAERASQLFQSGLALSVERLAGLATTVLPPLLGTYYWSPDTPVRRAAFLAYVAFYAAGVALLLVDTLRHQRRGGPPDARQWGRWLLLLVLVTPFAMVYVSSFARGFDHETSRYVLPVYIPLLASAGVLVVRVWRGSRVAGAVVLAFLLAFNLWTHVRYAWPLGRHRAERAGYIAAREALRRHLLAHPVEALYADDPFLSLVTAFHLWRVPVSELTAEFYLPHAVAADAATRVAILARTDRARLVEHLAQLGATYRATRFGRQVLFDEIRIPPRAYRFVSRRAWRARGAPPGPAALADGDLATSWPPEGADGPPAAEVVVDLGASYVLGRVIWWPSTDWEDTRPLALAVSADGVGWDPVAALPDRRPAFVAGARPFFRSRDGWLEVRFAPQRARYLRFTPSAPEPALAWGIAELQVYEDGGPLADGDAGPDGRALALLLGARGVDRLLADPAVAARVARASGGAIRTPPANGFLDSHGRYLPPARLAERVRLRATEALVVPEDDAEDLRGRLREAGVGFREEAVGGYRLLHGLAPVVPAAACRRARWRVAPALESTAVPDRLTLEVALRDARSVVGLRLEHPAPVGRDAPLPALALSQDGRSWRPVPGVRRAESWGWAGRTLFRFSQAAQELVLPATEARHLRVELPRPGAGPAAVARLCVRTLPRAGWSLGLHPWPGAGLMDGGGRVE